MANRKPTLNDEVSLDDIVELEMKSKHREHDADDVDKKRAKTGLHVSQRLPISFFAPHLSPLAFYNEGVQCGPDSNPIPLIVIDSSSSIDKLASDLVREYWNKNNLPYIVASGSHACHNVMKLLCFVHSKLGSAIKEPRDIRFSIDYTNFKSEARQMGVKTWVLRERPNVDVQYEVFVKTDTPIKKLATYLQARFQDMQHDWVRKSRITSLAVRYMGATTGYIAMEALFLARHYLIENMVTSGHDVYDVNISARTERSNADVATVLIAEVNWAESAYNTGSLPDR